MTFDGLSRALRSNKPLLRDLHTAARLRLHLFEHTDALRLHDADRDPIAGLTVERYGDYAVLSAYQPEIVAQRREIAEALIELGARGVYYKERVRADLRRHSSQNLAPSAPLWGVAAEPQFVVREGSLRFHVRIGDGLATGLFIDQRDNRSRLQERSRGANVLNLFSYTCSFSVAAAVGGAQRVTSVDLSGAALTRGNENLELNALPREQHRLLKADARKWLERAGRRPERYDQIVLDPPVFSSDGHDSFSVERDYDEMTRQCVQLLSPGGCLLAILNHRGTSSDQHRAIVLSAANAMSRTIRRLDTALPAEDCAQSGPAMTKGLLLQVA